jgi:tetratricopeptide (TPR) repeat protein
MAFALFFKRRMEEALHCAEKAALTNRNPVTYRILAATRAEAGRIKTAHEAVQELLKLQPNSCLRRSRQSSYRRPEDLELYVGALRKAGLPE